MNYNFDYNFAFQHRARNFVGVNYVAVFGIWDRLWDAIRIRNQNTLSLSEVNNEL